MTSAPVHLALVFHCNQAVTPFARVAIENCYRGLVRVLGRHPRARATFHWSGTLLTSLQWWCPDLVQRIRHQVERGRWEILASTHGQNVPCASPGTLNRLALGVHRAALRAAFPGTRPRGYWISERSWKPAMARAVAEAGLEYTLIEDHILADAGCTDLFRPRRIAAGEGRDLVVFTDNEDFKHRVNWALWTGDTGPALKYLRDVAHACATSGAQVPPVVTYAEDGEACGLWAAERGCPPQIVWEHLDRLLTVVEREPGIRLTCLSDYLDAHCAAIPREGRRIGRGQARWMCMSLADARLPYHEPGYRDWFDFNRRAEKLRRFRPIFRRAAQEVLAARPRTAAQRRLVFQAALALAAHTFEFGCIGVGHAQSRLWERHRVARLLLSLAAGEVRAPRGMKAIRTGSLLSLWSRRTGALLYLFDLRTGDEFVGNELAEPSIGGRGFDDEAIPDGRAPEPTWSAVRSGRQRLADFRGLWREVPREQGWMRFLLDWEALGAVPERVRHVVVPRDRVWDIENGRRERVAFAWPPPVRQRALVERVVVDGEVVLDVAALSRDREARGQFRDLGNGFEITHRAGPVTLVKRVRQRASAIGVEWALVNGSGRQGVTELQVASEWVPSYLAIVLFGGDCLETTPTGARNALTGAEVSLTLSTPSPRRTIRRRLGSALCGRVDQRIVRLDQVRGQSARVLGLLRTTRGADLGRIDSVTEEWKR